MKRLLLTLSIFLFHIVSFAQRQYDYMDDDAVAGGADRALNAFVIIFLIAVALFVVILVFGGIAKIKYELSPQSEIDRQKKAKEEREKQEKIRKEQEHQKALLALPENTIRLSIEGRPHLVELARYRLHPQVIAICLWSVNKIFWEGTDITEKVGFVEKYIDFVYAKNYQSPDIDLYTLSELIVSKRCVDLANKSSNTTFVIEFTIRGDFNPQKLQIIHHTHEGLNHEHIRRDINCLQYILYDGDIIQTHFANGEPMAFPYGGYDSYPQL